MDLYQPLYVPRPTVEPELFASLRPPTYGGAMTQPDLAVAENPACRRPGRRPVSRGFAGGNNAGISASTAAGATFINGGTAFNRYQAAAQLGNWRPVGPPGRQHAQLQRPVG